MPRPYGLPPLIDTVKVDAFSRRMSEKLDTGDTQARKAYMRAIINLVEVSDRAIWIVGSKDVIAGKHSASGSIRGFVRKWRAGRDSNP